MVLTVSPVSLSTKRMVGRAALLASAVVSKLMVPLSAVPSTCTVSSLMPGMSASSCSFATPSSSVTASASSTLANMPLSSDAVRRTPSMRLPSASYTRTLVGRLVPTCRLMVSSKLKSSLAGRGATETFAAYVDASTLPA